MSRLSTVAVSTLVPALKVLSTTLPDMTFFSLVRTNAPPLPGLTCWNSTTDQSWPSMLSTKPFFRSFVVATGEVLRAGLEDQQVLGSRRQQLGHAVTHDQDVLDPDPSAARQVDPRLDGDRRAGGESTRRVVAHQRS